MTTLAPGAGTDPWRQSVEGTRIRVMSLRRVRNVLAIAAALRLSHAVLSIGDIADIVDHTRRHCTLLVPEAPRAQTPAAILVLCDAKVVLPAVEAAVREAAGSGGPVVVVQPMRGDAAGRSPGPELRGAETEQQELLDLQLARFVVPRADVARPHVPIVGAVVWDELAATVRALAATTALVVLDSDALRAPGFRAAVTTALVERNVPVLVVPSAATGVG